jgi:hypothetical protein
LPAGWRLLSWSEFCAEPPGLCDAVVHAAIGAVGAPRCLAEREVPSRETPLLCARQPFVVQFIGELI